MDHLSCYVPSLIFQTPILRYSIKFYLSSNELVVLKLFTSWELHYKKSQPYVTLLFICFIRQSAKTRDVGRNDIFCGSVNIIVFITLILKCNKNKFLKKKLSFHAIYSVFA